MSLNRPLPAKYYDCRTKPGPDPGLFQAGTNVPTPLPGTALVRDGIYGHSRNPIYLGLTLVFLGLAALFNSLWFLALLPVVLAVMRYGVIAREERYPTCKFGDAYLKYKSRIGRWI